MTANRWEQLKGDPRLGRLGDLGKEAAEVAALAGLDTALFPALKDPDWLERVRARTGATFTIMVIGQVSSGKSSFINSLFGRRLFIPSDQPTDGVVSILQAVGSGEPERAEKVRRDGVVEPFASLAQAMAFLRQQETASDVQLQCQEVRVYLDEPWLRQLRIVNTPGLGLPITPKDTPGRLMGLPPWVFASSTGSPAPVPPANVLVPWAQRMVSMAPQVGSSDQVLANAGTHRSLQPEAWKRRGCRAALRTLRGPGDGRVRT